MIVIGVDVHKHSLTAVAVDEAGRMIDEGTLTVADDELLAWADRRARRRTRCAARATPQSTAYR
jgi:hypothetical protein